MQKGEKVFRLITKVIVRREDFGGLAFLPQTGEVIQLNHQGFRIVKQINENKKIRVLPENISFCQELEARGVISEVMSDE